MCKVLYLLSLLSLITDFLRHKCTRAQSDQPQRFDKHSSCALNTSRTFTACTAANASRKGTNGRFVRLLNRLSQSLWDRVDTRMMELLRACRNIASSVRLMIGSGTKLRLTVKQRDSWHEQCSDSCTGDMDLLFACSEEEFAWRRHITTTTLSQSPMDIILNRPFLSIIPVGLQH
ncbi:hypothetical protein DER44DRAFT_786722 [Fusarium oxysporum]|nr:hypothetical protein DER44DRAFT_786722 [Fusarium oxysporum]